ncbi:unnamed protein product [Blepharisma stoltei]|uniref:FBA domain-containing protein n=1 Tax=Blepharisma stoltei TaxID=1481888 RepID=A0AAU9IR30_9CILI|nr:unnamed protein product [Blepharisma stoltei]
MNLKILLAKLNYTNKFRNMGCCSNRPILNATQKKLKSFLNVFHKSETLIIENNPNNSTPETDEKNESYKKDFLAITYDFIDDSEDALAEFYNLTGIKLSSYEDFCSRIKISENLIKNPSGEEGFENWIAENKGEGWEIQNVGCYKGKKGVFVASYEWSSLKQTIDIPEGSCHRILLVGSHICRKAEYECEAKIRLKTFEKGCINEQEINFDCPYKEPIIDNFCAWTIMSLSSGISKQQQTVEVVFSGKDKLFASGHLGARFGFCFAYLIEYQN